MTEAQSNGNNDDDEDQEIKRNHNVKMGKMRNNKQAISVLNLESKKVKFFFMNDYFQKIKDEARGC